MSQDKEYIPEWHKPHIGSEARKFITFVHEDEHYCIKKKRIWEVLCYPDGIEKHIYSLGIRTKKGKIFCVVSGSKQTLEPIYQSILDQLNQ